VPQALFSVRPEGSNGLRLQGELDLSTVDLLTEEAARLEGPLTLDLAGLTFIDSTGIAAFIWLLNRGRLTLVNVQPRILNILRVAGIDRVPGVVIEPC